MSSNTLHETSGGITARLQRLKADDIVVFNDITGPQSIPVSLADVFRQHLAGDDVVERTLHDHDYLTLINRVLDADEAGRYISGVLYHGDKDRPVDPQSRLTFFRTVCRLVIEQSVPGTLDAALAEIRQSACTYKTFSLADRLWRTLPQLRRVGALWAAAFLLYDELSHGVPTTESPALPPPLDLHGYQDLYALMSHLLTDAPGGSLCDKLLNLLPMDLLRIASGQFRSASLQEIAAGADLVSGRQDRIAFFPGVTLTHSADTALDALLNCAPFAALQNQLVEALEWYNPRDKRQASDSMARQLTIQALIDSLYPVSRRRIGYVLDFHLFAEENADCSLYDIRINLTNSLRSTLGCRHADAQVIMQLLAARFAPELLLTDAPDDFRYQPDLRWANLRHAMTLDRAAAGTRTFAEWEALPASLTAQAVTTEEKLHVATTQVDAIIVWNLYQRHVTEHPRYAADEIARMTRYFESACNRQALNFPPDRINDARRLLINAGIDPDVASTSRHEKSTELEAYLDNGTAYRPPHPLTQPLPDATSQFNLAFDEYLKEARHAYTHLMTLFLDELPALHRDRLLSADIVCYAAEWRQYVGPMEGAVPSVGSSPASDWQDCRGGHGGLVHVARQGEHWVYELFPERHAFECMDVDASWSTQLEDTNLAAAAMNVLVDPDHEHYNGVPLPYVKSDLPKAVPLPRERDTDNQTYLVQSFVDRIFLHHSQALRETCKGATRWEAYTRYRESTSSALYAWNLIKSVVPIVGCFDVNTGGEALSCVTDVVGEAGTVMNIAGRTLKPLIKLGNKAQLWVPHPATPARPRQQNVKWFTGREAERASIEQRVHAARASVVAGKFIQRSGMFQRIPDTEAIADSALMLAKVDNVNQVLVRNISDAQTPDYRWCNPLDQKPYGPLLYREPAAAMDAPAVFITTQKHLLPGQFPGAVHLNEIAGHGHDLSVTSNRNIHVARRGQTITDLIIDDVSYRFDDQKPSGLLRKIELEPSDAGLGQWEKVPVHCVIRRGLQQASCSGALVLLSTTRPAIDPALEPLKLGEQASHAFMTRRFRPALRFTPIRGQATPQETHLLVDDGKVSTWVDDVPVKVGATKAKSTRRKALAALPEETALHMGIAAPLEYRPTVKGRLMKDQTLGLPDNLNAAWRVRINQELPVVQLDSICRTVKDQRELRAIRLTLEDVPYLAVEADTGQFYKATERPGNAQLTFERITSDAEIDAYLSLSEGYRLGAGRRTLGQDMDNIARMLFELESPGVDMQLSYRPYSSIMEGYARNILTQEHALENFVALTKSSIANFKQLAATEPLTRQHIATVLDMLLPASAAKHPWTPVPVAAIGLMTTGEMIRKHLNTTNLAFLLAQTSDGKRHVFYALAGGKRGKGLTLRVPEPHENGSVRFVDARERMSGQAPDTAFTSLPVLRTAKKLKIREHDRYLDAERLIVTAFKQDMPADTVVTHIHFFTLMDTCNSCGGFVLPRLKLDYPKADFSVSYILPYTAPT
ncbi:deaminase domain-containing protein [Pseudomonas sp. NFR16]|uniref:deaminase domain-containing protein n=1 Tax=Pseudomonas sp. NFR16 TaxID=1566248 RepID=UPI0008C71927|nr:deaminase domain-containing protein [Pseudomonas sp. NFR16]SEJ41888.1 The BURPS668_1122 family of deaminases [Pseudomonas sp. NFR16]